MMNYQNDKYAIPDSSGNAAVVILHILAGIKNLPTLPEINIKLLKACNDAHENIAEIAGLIKMDPSLTLKVMEMYYSGYKSSPNKLYNMEQALNLIGIDAVRTMVSCSSAVSIFEASANVRSFDLKHFWRHSLKCAFLTELLSSDAPNQPHDEAFLAGLFHDIGKLILFTSLPNIYGKLIADKTDQGNIALKEKKTIGIDHSQIGYKLIDRWRYYPFMADAMLYHHYPVEKIAVALAPVKILYVANLLASQEMSDQLEAFATAKSLLGLAQDKIEEYLIYSETKVSEAAAFFEIDNIPSGYAHSAGNGRSEASFNLANEIRDTSLIAYVTQNLLKAKDKESVLQMIKQGFQILFGRSDMYFFLYDKKENALVGHCMKDDEYSGLINGMRISIQSDSSILVSCLCNKVPIDSFSYQKKSDLKIMDFQLIHFAGKEGLFCLPLIEKDEQAGLIILGVEKAEYSFLSKQLNLLNLFARQCAIAILDMNRKELEFTQSHPVRYAPEGVLSRKIIHEINNPLSVIKNYLKVLGMKLADHDIEHDEIRIINDEINRIVKMLRNLSSPSDKGPMTAKEPVNVNALLVDIIKLTNGSLADGSEIKIQLDNDPAIPEILTEKDNLKQVFINLIKNAIEAMPKGGNIGIKTSYTAGFSKDDGGNRSGNSNGKIQINVTDDGPGISDEIRSALFNEFVTSKEGHEGLGLSIVKNIITKLNGSIKCESITEKGTSFTIDLPLKTV
jgi:nitrogen-specific signal transduction histidine kinase/HD-like signal output (HDOD) protein